VKDNGAKGVHSPATVSSCAQTVLNIAYVSIAALMLRGFQGLVIVPGLDGCPEVGGGEVVMVAKFATAPGRQAVASENSICSTVGIVFCASCYTV
jgi:hypothetical protein